MYFVYMYENRTMKLTEIWEMKENDGGVSLIKIHCKHIHK
jgi:hypothetical protein